MSQELKPYRVTIAHDACTTHDVHASNPDDAADEAMSAAGVTLCHQCSRELELGDPVRTLIVEDLTTGEYFDDIDPSHEVVVLRAKVAELEAALARTQQPEQAASVEVVAPKLIGWRSENYLWETDDIDKARNWEPNIGVLPIFEGDPNTKLCPTQQPEQVVPEGFVLVPVVPTPEMRNAYHMVSDDAVMRMGDAGSRWAAMLAASGAKGE